MKVVSQKSSVTLFGIADNRDGVSDNVGHTLLQCDYNSVHPCIGECNLLPNILTF